MSARKLVFFDVRATVKVARYILEDLGMSTFPDGPTAYEMGKEKF